LTLSKKGKKPEYVISNLNVLNFRIDYTFILFQVYTYNQAI